MEMHVPSAKVKRSPRLASFTSVQACQYSREKKKTNPKLKQILSFIWVMTIGKTGC